MTGSADRPIRIPQNHHKNVPPKSYFRVLLAPFLLHNSLFFSRCNFSNLSCPYKVQILDCVFNKTHKSSNLINFHCTVPIYYAAMTFPMFKIRSINEIMVKYSYYLLFLHYQTTNIDEDHIFLSLFDL